jgi:hypothetical protein
MWQHTAQRDIPRMPDGAPVMEYVARSLKRHYTGQIEQQRMAVGLDAARGIVVVRLLEPGVHRARGRNHDFEWSSQFAIQVVNGQESSRVAVQGLTVASVAVPRRQTAGAQRSTRELTDQLATYVVALCGELSRAIEAHHAELGVTPAGTVPRRPGQSLQ